MSMRCAPNSAPARRAIIVGGGYIGLEAAAVACEAWALRPRCLEMAPRILQRVASPETSAHVRALHQRAWRHDPGRIPGSTASWATAASPPQRLKDGREELPADFVIVGVGITPGTHLAAGGRADAGQRHRHG
jgi:3-phenylpropionate/trans-cinnamate dioxygenase ferredoxin reductase subunit